MLVPYFVFLDLTIWRMSSAVWQWRQFFSYTFWCWRKELSDLVKGVLVQDLRRLVYHSWCELVNISWWRLFVLRGCWGSNRWGVVTRFIMMFLEIKSFAKMIWVSGEWCCGSSLWQHLSLKMLGLIIVRVWGKYLRVKVVRVNWQSSTWAEILLFQIVIFSL